MSILWLFIGAGSGIGRATCKILAREGATIIAADQNIKAAEETIKPYVNGTYYFFCISFLWNFLLKFEYIFFL